MIRVSRLRNGRLQTRVATYTSRDGARQVTLIGTVHVGDPAYYDTIRTLIDTAECDGAAVHREGVTAAPDAAWATATDAEIEAGRALNTINDLYDMLAGALGWVTQAAMGHSPRWRVTDMTDLDVIRAEGPAKITRMCKVATGLLDEKKRPLAEALAPLPMRLMAIPGLRRMVSMTSPVDLLTSRNRIALDALPGSGWTVMIWGAAHLPGLARGLRRTGFRHSGSSWLDAGQVPTIRQALRNMAALIRQQAAEAGGRP